MCQGGSGRSVRGRPVLEPGLRSRCRFRGGSFAAVRPRHIRRNNRAHPFYVATVCIARFAVVDRDARVNDDAMDGAPGTRFAPVASHVVSSLLPSVPGAERAARTNG